MRLRMAAFNLVIWLTCIIAPHAHATERWKPSLAEQNRMSQEVSRLLARLEAGGERGRISWSTYTDLLLNNLATVADPNHSSIALNGLLALQDKDPQSPTYGNIRWYDDITKIVDWNGIEFVTQRLLIVMRLYNDRLSPEQSKQIRDFLDLARIGIQKHRVDPAYTNIFLMKAANLIGLGDILDQPELTDTGRQLLAGWLARARRIGVEEYLSPVYTAVDIENLALVVNLSNDPEARLLARAGLDILWTDVALHWYRAGERLGGPHSRDYNRLLNRSTINELVARAGWSDDTQEIRLKPFTAYAYAPPSPATDSLFKAPLPRFVVSRVGEAPEKRIAAYVGRSLYLGSAGTGYHSHDNLLVANLGSGAEVPTISAFMDGRGDHYGTKPYIEKASGHPKIQHLRPFVASAQNGAEALFLLSSQGSGPEGTMLETTVILPADADYFLDGRPLDLFRKTTRWKIEPRPMEGRTALSYLRAVDGRTEVLLSDRSEADGIGLAQQFPAENGDRITLSAEMAGGPITLYINFEDEQGNVIGGENIRPAAASAQFRRVDFKALAPPGTVRVRAWLYSQSKNRTELRLRDLTVSRFRSGMSEETLARYDFETFRPDGIPIQKNSTLIIRRNDAALAVRPLGAFAPDGSEIEFRLINDGLQYGAVRMTATHSNTQTDGRGTAALWLGGREGLFTDQSFDEFVKKVTSVQTALVRQDDDFEMDASGFGISRLRLQANVTSGERRAVEGIPTFPPSVSVLVDGTALAR